MENNNYFFDKWKKLCITPVYSEISNTICDNLNEDQENNLLNC